MGFDVAPAPVHRRGSRLPAIAVVAVGIAVVVVALVTADPGVASRPGATPATSSALEAAVSPPSPSSTPRPPSALAVPPRPARLPGTIECHELGSVTCGELVHATMAVLPPGGPPVSAIDAWGSILCGDSLDCPPQWFVGYRPLGSTVVSFTADGIKAWVNVVEPAPFPGRVWDPTRTVAWIVRWQP